MNVTDFIATSAVAAVPADLAAPRAVDAAASEKFRNLMSASECGEATAACDAQPSLQGKMGLDIEKILMANLPPPNASSAEFAVSMLRAQVKVAQAAIAIEMVNKTTQSLSQGVQSLTSRS